MDLPLPTLMHFVTHDYENFIIRDGKRTLKAELIGIGEFSDVFKFSTANGLPKISSYIVKRLRIQFADDDEIKRVLNEHLIHYLKVWNNLSHPNVADLSGVYVDTFTGILAIEVLHYPNGNIIEYLKNSARVSSKLRLQLIRDALHGLSYLHSNGVVHGNLRGSNVLITIDGRAVLTDPNVNTTIRGTSMFVSIPESINWMPAELVIPIHPENDIRPTTGSDVYSLGRTAQEIYTLKAPFAHLRATSRAQLVIKLEPLWSAGIERPTEIPSPVWDVLQGCFAIRPCDRPTCEILSQKWDRL